MSDQSPPHQSKPERISELDRARFSEAHLHVRNCDLEVSELRSALETKVADRNVRVQRLAAINEELVNTYGLTPDDRIVFETGEILRTERPTTAVTSAQTPEPSGTAQRSGARKSKRAR